MEYKSQEFTTDRWEYTLAKVYTKAIHDVEYRHLCLSNPRAAVAVVAPELDVPADFHFRFADQEAQVSHWYLLPPVLTDQTNTDDYINKLVERLSGWTHPPTINRPPPPPPPPPTGQTDAN